MAIPLSVKSGGILSLCVVLAAYFYKQQQDELIQKHIENVLTGLLKAEQKVKLPSHAEKRVAVGFGACQDVISDALTVLDKLKAEPPLEPEHFNSIENLETFEKVFAYFFRHAAAAERYINNVTLFEELVEIARSLPDTQIKLGGNAPVMANRFHLEGCKVLLGGTTSTALRDEIPGAVKLAGANLDEDDIHLSLEYKKGAEWGPYKASRANRFFFHHDLNNPYLASLEDFQHELEMFSPTLLVVGGLQMLDNFPFNAGERRTRLMKLQKLLTETHQDTRIHFEMASFAEEECLEDVIDHVVYYSDSLGMNEQELPNLHSVLANESVTLISDPNPRIATTLDHMRAVFTQLEKTPAGGGKRQLTRLHVHTLAYQAIMTTKGSSWKNSMSAAAKASLTANRHTCGSPDIDTETAHILMDDSFSTTRDSEGQRIQFNVERPIACWDEGQWEICIAPVLVCTDVVQTGGGGDNVSSAGLVLQI